MKPFVTQPCKVFLSLSALFVMAYDCQPTYGADSYYTVPPLFFPAPGEGRRAKDWVVPDFGPVGIGITLKLPPFTMVINNVKENSPAAATGQLKKGQVIESINGVVLKDRDPREILGDIITQAEATDGLIRLKIRDLGDVVVNIPVMGAYSDTWPLDCPKSDKIVRKLADLLATQEKPTWGSALFLLSTGEEKDLAVVRKWLSGSESIGSIVWSAGYQGIAYCEYYLRTGDESVLPAIRKMGIHLKEMMYNGGWSGRGDGASFNYSTGTGQMHAAGVHAVTFLMLAKLCGVDIDNYTFHEALKTFYRFAGHENVPYGDGWPEGGFRDNGKSAGLAVALAAAARLTPNGEDSLYAEARDHVAMKSFYGTSWFHAAHTGGGIGEIWHNAAMSMMYERRPVQHRSFLDTRRWVMELSRRHDGSIGIAGVVDGYDQSATEHERSWGNYFALTYTIPRKKLVVFGAPLPPWAKTYPLPERPWGRPADDAFIQTEPVSSKLLTMQDMLRETVQTDASLALFDRLGAAGVSDKTLASVLVHPEMGYRVAAIRKIVELDRAQFVLPLLRSRDPRMRHVGLLAITGMFKGRALPDDKLTPEMFEAIGKMIEDPNESLWVVQQALLAISRAPVEVIGGHLETIMAYMQHDDWFLRARAIDAILPLATHPDYYRAVMPPVFQTLAQFTTASALAPAWSLKKKLAQAPRPIKDFAMDQLIVAYDKVPAVMQFPGGRVVKDGARAVRAQMAGMMESLPGGENYLITQPKMTLAAARSGNDRDMYVYSGTFTPNDALVGEWHWAVWPRPKTEEDVEKGALAWIARKRQERPKDVLVLDKQGGVKSSAFKGYLWSGDMLISVNDSIARKMTLRHYGEKDFLIIESGDFTPDAEEVAANWGDLYTIYMRVK